MGVCIYKSKKKVKMQKLLFTLSVIVSCFQYEALPQFKKHPSFTLFFKGNIIDWTIAQAEATKSTLRSLSDNPQATKYIKRVIDSSKCLDSLEDAIDGIDTASKLVYDNRNSILRLISSAENLENEKDTIKLLESSGDIFRILDDLIPDLAEEPVDQCNASPIDTLKELGDIARLLNDVSIARDLQLDPLTTEYLKESAKVVDEVTKFLRKTNRNLASFKKLCSKNKDYNVNVISSIGDIMDDMAELFASLGSKDRAEDIRKKGKFVKESVDAFSDLYVVTDLECGTNGSLKALADNLDDLAQIVKEVGMKKLSEELDINLDFLSNF